MRIPGNPPLAVPLFDLPDPGGGAAGTPLPGDGFLPSPSVPDTQPAGGGGGLKMPPPEIFPWWLYEMDGSQDWAIPSTSTAFNFVVAASGVTKVPSGANQFTFTVPGGNWGVIKAVQATVQNPLATMLLSFTLLRNGYPIPGWSNVFFPPLSATALVLPFNGMIVRLNEAETLTALFTEASGAAWTCSLQASGWITPKGVVDRWQGRYNY